MGYNIKIFNRRILQTKSEQNPDTCLRNYTHTHTHTLVNRLVELSPVIELNLWNVLFSSLASKYGTRSTHMYIDSDDVRSTLKASTNFMTQYKWNENCPISWTQLRFPLLYFVCSFCMHNWKKTKILLDVRQNIGFIWILNKFEVYEITVMDTYLSISNKWLV